MTWKEFKEQMNLIEVDDNTQVYFHTKEGLEEISGIGTCYIKKIPSTPYQHAYIKFVRTNLESAEKIVIIE